MDNKKLVPNEMILINICGNIYKRITDSNGIAGIAIDLTKGTYDIIIYYEKDPKVTISSTIVVN